jgi:hypothetical protein
MAGALDSRADVTRISATSVIADFCQDSKLDFADHTEDLVRLMLKAFADRNPEVVHAAWGGLAAVVKRIATDKQRHMDQIKQTIL